MKELTPCTVVIKKQVYIVTDNSVRASTEEEAATALKFGGMQTGWRPSTSIEAQQLHKALFKPRALTAEGTSTPKPPNTQRTDTPPPLPPKPSSRKPLPPVPGATKPGRSPVRPGRSMDSLLSPSPATPPGAARKVEVSASGPSDSVWVESSVVRKWQLPKPQPPFSALKPPPQAGGSQPSGSGARPKALLIPGLAPGTQPRLIPRQKQGPESGLTSQAFISYEELKWATRTGPTISVWDERFSDIRLPSGSAVKLPNPTERGAMTPGKIHASHITRYPSAGCRPILTQYPDYRADIDRSSVSNFWQMALQEECDMVLDLTKPSEQGKLGPAYYPGKVGQSMTFGSMEVMCTSHHSNNMRFRVTDTSTGAETSVLRRHHQEWPDHGGINPEELLKIAQAISGSKAPIVHCRAGVGRSGTSTAAAAVLEIHRQKGLTHENHVALLTEAVLKLRDDRGPHAVQTSEQWESLQAFTLMLLKHRPGTL